MKKILYTCPYIPAEWIAAHGLKPCRIIPHLTVHDSEIIRTEGLCPYVRDFINNLKEEKKCGVVVTTVCDQMRRGFDIIQSRFELPAFLMNVPSTWQTVTSQKLYQDELKRLGKFLIRLGGKAPSNDILIQIMIEYDTARKSLLEAKVNLSARQFAEMMAIFGKDGPHEFTKTLSSNKTPAKGIPLAIVGGPLLKQNFVILDLAEKLGGRIVLNATETGERGLCAPFDRRILQDNPLMELANAYFNGIYDASRRPNSELYQWLKNTLVAREVHGIIFHRNIWCDIWHAELQRLKEWVGLPVLDIDSTGDGESNQHRNENRIRAFLEMLH